MGSSTKLQFVSSFRGIADFKVLSGPMKGKVVRIRFMTASFYGKDYDAMQDGAFCLYERDIIKAAGIVDCNYEPVTSDVLSALSKGFENRRNDFPFSINGHFSTGWYEVNAGWKHCDTSGVPELGLPMLAAA